MFGCLSYLYAFILSYFHTFIQVTRTNLWGKKTNLWGRKTNLWGSLFFGVEEEALKNNHLQAVFGAPLNSINVYKTLYVYYKVFLCASAKHIYNTFNVQSRQRRHTQYRKNEAQK